MMRRFLTKRAVKVMLVVGVLAVGAVGEFLSFSEKITPTEEALKHFKKK